MKQRARGAPLRPRGRASRLALSLLNFDFRLVILLSSLPLNRMHLNGRSYAVDSPPFLQTPWFFYNLTSDCRYKTSTWKLTLYDSLPHLKIHEKPPASRKSWDPRRTRRRIDCPWQYVYRTTDPLLILQVASQALTDFVLQIINQYPFRH